MTDKVEPPAEPGRTEPIAAAGPAKPRWTPPSTGSIVLGAVLVLVGVGWLLQTSGVLDLSLTVVLSALLIVVGAGLILTARSGRHGGLVALGVVLSLLLGLFTAVDIRLDGGIGERKVHPRAFAVVADEYHLAVGQLQVDLSDVSVPATGTVKRIEVTLGIGQVTVTVPPEARVEVVGHAGMGQVVLFGEEHDGVDVEERSGRNLEGAVAGPNLVLTVSVGLGQATVRTERS